MTVLGDLLYKTIGRSEKVHFIEFGARKIPAKIDTGAKTSALWASKIKETSEGLEFCLFGPSSPLYTGERFIVHRYDRVAVASSIGESQERYKIQTVVKVRGKKIRASFTLADRSRQAYPILLGRNVLRGKFLVDVKSGKPDLKAERARSELLQSKIKEKSEKS